MDDAGEGRKGKGKEIPRCQTASAVLSECLATKTQKRTPVDAKPR